MLLGPEAELLEVPPCLQEYCALTLPHSAAQPEQLARHMALLRPVPGCSFPQVVLLLHRAGLALHMGADWEVRGIHTQTFMVLGDSTQPLAQG